MKKLFLLCLPLFVLFACKKEDTKPKSELVFQGNETLPDGTPMDCELLDEMYLSKTLDFTSWGFMHTGWVTFNDDGSCSGDSTFMSWEYWELEGDQICNIITVKFRGDNDEIIPSMISFTKYDLDYVKGVRFDNADVYYFSPR